MSTSLEVPDSSAGMDEASFHMTVDSTDGPGFSLADTMEYLKVHRRPTIAHACVLNSAISEEVLKSEYYQLQINEFSAKLKKSQETISYYKALLAPFRLLPVELVRQIFVDTLPETPTPPNSRHSPLLLCQVSSEWRAIALSTPALFEYLLLSGSHPPGFLRETRSTNTDARNVEILDFWIRHTADLPMVLLLSTTYSAIPPGSLVVEKLIPYLHKLSGLHLSISREEDMESFAYQPGGRMPLLEKLSIFLPAHKRLTREVTLFDSAPHLRFVTLRISGPTAFVDLPKVIRLPWAQLGRLRMPSTPINAAIWVTLIRQCVSLRGGIFLIGTSGDETFPSQPPISLGNLWSLKVEIMPGTPGDLPLYEGLSFPNLKVFSLSYFGHDHEFLWSRTPHLFHQLSRCSLKTLILGHVDIPANELYAILTHSRGLKALALDISIDLDELLTFLTRSSPPESPLPELTDLMLVTRSHFFPANLRNMVISRGAAADGQTRLGAFFLYAGDMLLVTHPNFYSTYSTMMTQSTELHMDVPMMYADATFKLTSFVPEYEEWDPDLGTFGQLDQIYARLY